VDDQAGAPRVSVLLRTKDRPGLLAEALGSLRRQTFSNFETVLVNDGGPIVSSLLEPAPGLGVTVVVPPRPGGRSRALNAGLAAARGTYVAYLDDDDLYLPDHLEKLARFLDGSDEYGAAYTSVRQIQQVLGEDGRYRDGRELTMYGRPFDAARLLYKNDIPLLGLSHRRALAEEAGSFDETFDQFEDWDFLIRLAALTKFHHLPSVTAVYRVRNDASNVTAAVPWRSPEAQAARRRLFEKHAARRSPATEMALVDSLEHDANVLRDEGVEARREIGALRQALVAAQRENEVSGAALLGAVAREQALAAENARLSSIVDAMNRSLAWRLFTPWWKLKELLNR
jgi:glycosyltransferase involved in cell wall biosynthesis